MKEIKDFPGYFVTEDGRVLSYKTKSRYKKDSVNYDKTPKELKFNVDPNGYNRVKLYKNGKGITCKVHRLVAQAYIENPENCPCVNHKNKIRTDNRIENLEWCSVQYNCEYSLARYFLIETPEGEIIKIFNLNQFTRENNIPLGGSFSTGKAAAKGYKVIKKVEE